MLLYALLHREKSRKEFFCVGQKKPKKEEEDLIMDVCPCKTMVRTPDIGMQLHRLIGVDTKRREPNL